MNENKNENQDEKQNVQNKGRNKKGNSDKNSNKWNVKCMQTLMQWGTLTNLIYPYNRYKHKSVIK